MNPEADWVDTLRFFYYKFRSNTSDSSYDELRSILRVYRVDVKSPKSTREHLRVLLGIPIRKYDSCIGNCMAFTGRHKLRRRCLHCGQPRFDETTDDEEELYPDLLSFATFKPRATYSYIPIIPRLKLLYANKTYSKKMRYPKWGMTDEPWLDGLSGVRDVWEGNMMKQWKEAGITWMNMF